MTLKHVFMFLALVAIAALLFTTLTGVRAEDDVTSNGDYTDTTLYLAESESLWIPPPDEDANAQSITVLVDEGPLGDYVDVGTWNSSALDKDLHAQGQITFLFHINASDNEGPSVRFRITMFGETFVTDDYYATNTGVSPVLVSFTVDGSVAFDEKISMRVEVDGRNQLDGTVKELHFHYWSEDYPSEVSFLSNATDISMEVIRETDNQDVRLYEIYINITDAFGEIHVNEKSYILNITSRDEPENYTAEDRNDGGTENKSDYIELESAQYWPGFRYIAAKYIWYYEGVDKYANGRKGQGVQPGDYDINFDMKDIEGNDRFYHHLKTGVSPIYVHVNVHTHPSYITIVDDRNHDVPEVAQHDEVRVRVHLEMNKGLPDHIYLFYVELRDNGVLVTDGRQYVQMEGRTGLNLFFDWDPIQGTRTLTFEADSDNDINEVDESDNDVERAIEVIEEARPNVIISHPSDGAWFNEGVKVLFDASNSTNPISGDMTFEWFISQWDGEDYISKESLNGDLVTTNKNYKPGRYKAELTVTNDKRTVTRESIFFINALPEIQLDSPYGGEVYNADEDILFDASGTEDEDGDILYFLWISDQSGVLNKDGNDNVDYLMDRFGKDLNGGEHQITLEVTDYDPTDPPENGKRGFSEEVITIIVNSPPNVEITTPLDGTTYSAKVPVEFDASRTEDPDGDELTFSWTDGNRYMSSEVVFNETLDSGTHDIKLEVSDGKSMVVTELTINVGSPPEASTASSASGELKDGKAKVKLDASESTPADDSNPIQWYIWDRDVNFDSDGDGISSNDEDYKESNPVVELQYNKTGSYTASLVVEDSAGMRSQPFSIDVAIEKGDEDDDELPVELIGGVVGTVAAVVVVLFILLQRREYEDEDEEDYEDEEYEEYDEYEAEYEDAEYDAEYY